MSMSRGCLLVEYADKEWYCIIARDEYDYDFRSFDISGPAKTEDDAFNTHEGSNPGSSQTVKKEDIGDWEKEAIEIYGKLSVEHSAIKDLLIELQNEEYKHEQRIEKKIVQPMYWHLGCGKVNSTT